jgi:predicted small lipoprotein YifL
MSINTITKDWNWMRALRLFMGVTAIWQAFTMRETLLGIAGTMLLLMSIFNIGRCGMSGCAITPPQKKKADAGDELLHTK